ncbi:MAG: response regulator, partial [Psychrobium sp.]|nr:response regulator [Psychrobium sp.]
VGLPFIVFACWWSSRFTRPIVEMVNSTKAIAQGDLDQHIDIQSNDELGQLASAINEMSANITKTFKDSESNLWLQQGIEGLSVTMRGNQISTDLADNIVGFVSNYLNAKIGTLYIVKEHNLELAGGYAYVPNAEGQSITFGDGLVGQAAISKEVITITDVPKDYIPISSSLGKVAPSHLIIYPIMKEDVVLGVIELGWLDECHAQSFAFLDSISESVATALAVSESHQKLQTLLDQSQQQMEELQVREEELRAINDEVEQRSSQLANSQKALEQQSQKLLNTNEALKQKTASLEQQKAAIETKNTLIEQSSREIEKKADELEAASQYKSEFLANMSHELRTPLNSMLILSRILYDNDEENLDEDQVESAKVIHNSGQELLSLINDILDLSKIEAGKMDTLYESYDIRDIGNDLRGQFNAIANDKGLDFVVDIAHDIPHNIELDVQKTLQILKNLLSNAMKFTDNGAVTLKAQLVNNVADPSAKASILSISVTDSGIGISPAKQQEIFEAFQQADGSTSRKYGGTGLGLTISRHLADLIDGEIFVTSEENVGSTFSIYLPLVESDSIDEELNGQSVDVDNSIGEMAMLVEQQSTSNNLNNVPPVNAETEQENEPNRNNLEYDVSPTDKVLVIIEDDIAFAKVLSGIASKSGFKCLLADTAKKGLALVNDYLPCGVILDLGLPDMSGADALDIIKQDPRIKNIPIHIISGHDKTNEMTQKGAAAFHQKPINKQEIDNLLENLIQAPIHHHDGSIRQQVMVFEDELSVTDIDFSYLDKQPIDVVRVNTFDELSHNIGNTPYHVASIILKCRQLTPTCEAWLREHEQHARDIASQIILMLDETPTNEQAIILEKYGCQVIIHGTHSAQRLHDEIILFLSNINLGLLHSAGDTPVNGSDLSSSPLAGMLTASPTPLPIKTANEEENIPSNDLTFEDCKVLLVDDDLRNTFALSKVLKKHGMNVVLAENGKMALDKLEQNDDINIVLMDIMMPVMDGHEAMRKIRAQEKYKTLPIIALTAKAMQEDRRRCVEAGASDYLTKPVDIDKLVAMMRVWLYQELA